MNPDVIYGRDFEEESMEIEKIDGPIGEVVIRGKILSVDTREIRNAKTLIIFSVTDFTDTIVLKIFARNDDVPELLKEISGGKFVRVKGVATIDKFDSELTIGSIVGIKKCADFTTVRMDTSVEKRIELHCHTKMSEAKSTIFRMMFQQFHFHAFPMFSRFTKRLRTRIKLLPMFFQPQRLQLMLLLQCVKLRARR